MHENIFDEINVEGSHEQSHWREAFSHQAVMRRHKYRHMNPEKYKCDFCGNCFVSARGLENHVKRKHLDADNDARPFACDFDGCQAVFKYEEYLQGHKREVHLRKRVRVRSKKKKVGKRFSFQDDDANILNFCE